MMAFRSRFASPAIERSARMPSVGPLELVILLVLALVIFGPKRLPEIGRSVGEGIRELKDTITTADPRDERHPERRS
jgi:sec-independent protein translocase protein TatA